MLSRSQGFGTEKQALSGNHQDEPPPKQDRRQQSLTCISGLILINKCLPIAGSPVG